MIIADRKFSKIRLRFLFTLLLLGPVLTLSGCKAGGDEALMLRDEGVLAYETGDFETALDDFDAALQASFGEVSEFTYDLLRYKAECELRLGRLDSARSSYEALLELEPGDSDFSSDYEELLAELDALDRLEAANELFESLSYEEAFKAYKAEASLDGSASGRIAWFNEACAAEYLGDFEEAAWLLNEYLTRYPDDEAALRELEFAQSRAEGAKTR